jgi:uncharacterized protein
MGESQAIDLSQVADKLGLKTHQVVGVMSLLDDGNTVPFITRYRKEQTGNLNETQIRDIAQRVDLLRQLAERAAAVLRLIETQGKLTPELQAAIAEAGTLKRLEDIYLPYRPKRSSRASQARERGLQPLADRIWNDDSALGPLEAAARDFVDPAQNLPGTAEVLQGVGDIIVERISDSADLRERVRRLAWSTGRLSVSVTKTGEEQGQEYRNYFDYNDAISRIPPHRVLAINRGEEASALRVKFECDRPRIERTVADYFEFSRRHQTEFLTRCATDAVARLILPSLQREFRRELSERAERHAVDVFAENLRHLLLQPPLQGKCVTAIDPGFRSGCKIAVLDDCGNLLAHDVIFVTGGAEKRVANRQKLAGLLEQHDCQLVAIGNGTACRETEELVAEMIAEDRPDARYVIVNEAGASIYSASEVAGEEFPDLDATVRGTISIGRRLQDPLSEQVKIDPQHLGVGLYQHDVDPKRLKESLDRVVESCVNYVGVDLNTASASLLRHVSGFTQRVAKHVVEWRNQHGRFTNRRQLLDVPGLGAATFQQAAGFLKISGGDNLLDSTPIHPESYPAANRILNRLTGRPRDGDVGALDLAALKPKLTELIPNPEQLADELQIGAPTCRDILEALARPGRDPRTSATGPVFKQGVLNLDDLNIGMELTGTVLNVVDFGAFIDVGLKESGLVHISKMADRFVSSPHEVVAIGDVIAVWVLSIDRERRRVSLTMLKPDES